MVYKPVINGITPQGLTRVLHQFLSNATRLDAILRHDKLRKDDIVMMALHVSRLAVVVLSLRVCVAGAPYLSSKPVAIVAQFMC